jgi:hypothetical protein
MPEKEFVAEHARVTAGLGMRWMRITHGRCKQKVETHVFAERPLRSLRTNFRATD